MQKEVVREMKEAESRNRITQAFLEQNGQTKLSAVADVAETERSEEHSQLLLPQSLYDKKLEQLKDPLLVKQSLISGENNQTESQDRLFFDVTRNEDPNNLSLSAMSSLKEF